MEIRDSYFAILDRGPASKKKKKKKDKGALHFDFPNLILISTTKITHWYGVDVNRTHINTYHDPRNKTAKNQTTSADAKRTGYIYILGLRILSFDVSLTHPKDQTNSYQVPTPLISEATLL